MEVRSSGRRLCGYRGRDRGGLLVVRSCGRESWNDLGNSLKGELINLLMSWMEFRYGMKIWEDYGKFLVLVFSKFREINKI